MKSTVNHPLLNSKNVTLDLLRLDQIHPLISGNKWYKLKYNIDDALAKNKNTLLSFGGAYSNHLHALAYMGKMLSLKTIGIVRGECVKNDTLNDCEAWGMKLIFISREEYKNKSNIDFLRKIITSFSDAYIIPEGGANQWGFLGCKEILSQTDKAEYDVFCCSVGTSITFAGIIDSLPSSKIAYGFCAMKNGEYLQNTIKEYTPNSNYQLITQYHFGGFAKQNQQLLTFMKSFQSVNNIELDFVYDAKMLFGIFDLIKTTNLFENKKILAIHTGGLQGNRSLKNN
ncbi:MAG: 1-aminocyclopropane-1-carboxylate deaminase/D-cysteine desulfhydrase [Chitinophagaceae bacterium]|nr:1-aminocyclopropane-1-carboxylate deaminase/D-cysteine desulfhydrase [Chitinophagaceae bacterium]